MDTVSSDAIMLKVTVDEKTLAQLSPCFRFVQSSADACGLHPLSHMSAVFESILKEDDDAAVFHMQRLEKLQHGQKSSVDFYASDLAGKTLHYFSDIFLSSMHRLLEERRELTKLRRSSENEAREQTIDVETVEVKSMMCGAMDVTDNGKIKNNEAQKRQRRDDRTTENEPRKKKMKNEGDETGDFFPLDNLPITMQLAMYEYVNGWTMNELRKVDRLRRRLMDGKPCLFEKKRLIPAVAVEVGRNPNEGLRLEFNDYCKFCKEYSKNTLYFDIVSARCTKGNWRCLLRCKGPGAIHNLPTASPVIGLSLEECYPFAIKGSKIKELTLNHHISSNFVQSVRHLIDSSLRLNLVIREFESAELCMNLVQEPRKLNVLFYNFELLSDEFFRIAGKYFLRVECPICTNTGYLPLTDEQLGILAERRDLTDISLGRVDGITSEGLKRSIQILLHSSPKNITMTIGPDDIDKDSLKVMPESDEVFIEEYCIDKRYYYKYSYGGGKVEVTLPANKYYCYYEIKMSSH